MALTNDTDLQGKGFEMLNLATIEAQSSNLTQAESLCNKSLLLLEKTGCGKSSETAMGYCWLAYLLSKKQKFPEAEKAA